MFLLGKEPWPSSKQQTNTYSKVTLETPEKGVKYVQS